MLTDIVERLAGFGLAVRAGLAEAPGAAWAVARHGNRTKTSPGSGAHAAIDIIPPGALISALGPPTRRRPATSAGD